VTLKPRCECSTCDACPNPPDRSGTCVNCFDGQPEFGDPAGSHEPLSDRELDAIRDEDEYAAASLPASAIQMYEVLRDIHAVWKAGWDAEDSDGLLQSDNAYFGRDFDGPFQRMAALMGDQPHHDPESLAALAAYNGGRVCYICGIENIDTTKARLGDVAGQVTAIADRIVNVCGVGKCDA
jgi:hypothetical protein